MHLGSSCRSSLFCLVSLHADLYVSVQYNDGFLPDMTILFTLCLYFQHAHFIPIVGVGKERRILIGPW